MNAQSPVEWRISKELAAYPEAVSAMEARVAAISAGEAPEQVWLVEHPPLYTAGTSADNDDLLDADRFPVY
jgi:lipoyl(octanoyl) transferase